MVFVEGKKNNISNRGKDETELAGILYPLDCSDGRKDSATRVGFTLPQAACLLL